MKKSRQELFELEWTMPMTKLAKKFELSDVGLRKICVKHQFPLPLQGHWTRKQFGKEAPRPTCASTCRHKEHQRIRKIGFAVMRASGQINDPS